ncbi:MAG: hypothetical protein B6I30_06590, partial [Desulfobacteraceae bacterium 4572_187]
IPFDTRLNRLFLTFGHTNERYCLPSGVETRYEMMIHDHLRRNGYKCIVFFSHRGAFFFDKFSHDAATDTGTKKNGSEKKLPSNKLVPAPGGLSLRDRVASKNAPALASSFRYLYRDMAKVTTMAPMIRRLIRNSDINTAVVFADDRIHSTLSSSDLNTNFRAFLENEINSLPIENQNIIIFNFPGESPASTLKLRGWDFLFREDHSGGRNTGAATPVYLGPPDADEVKNHLLSLHLKYDMDMDSVHFPRIVNQLTSWIKRNNLGLSALSHFHSGLPLNTEEAKKMTGDNIAGTAQEQMDNLVGMEDVREYIQKKQKSFEAAKRTATKAELNNTEIHRLVPPSPEEWIKHLRIHLVLTGNPGTGKTTIARLFGEFYREFGILPLGHTVKATRADLVAEYVGQSAPKTRRMIHQSLGGVLFIDEAYDLCRGKDDTFGLEAVATLVEAMTDHNGRFMVVIAGYPEDIKTFLETNEGLSSRFSERLHLKDYNPDQLEDILRRHIPRIGHLPVHKEFEEGLPGLCNAIYGDRNKKFGNARDMESLAVNLHEAAVYADDDAIRPRHLPEQYQKLFEKPETTDAGILGQLDNMIGLNGVKEKVNTIFNRLKAKKIRNGENAKIIPGHFLFVGNPGTGKTTVAKLMAEQFFSLDIVQSKQLQQTTAGKLIKGYVGQTSEATGEFLRQGLGKIIFIDEAHQLFKGESSSTNYGQDVIDALVPFVEDHREECVVILAGYEMEMAAMIRGGDAGLKDRFPNRVVFEDYSPEELVEIFDLFLKEKKMAWPVDTCGEFMQAYFSNLKAETGQTGHKFGNGRAVRNTVEECLNRLANRLDAVSEKDPSKYAVLTEEDLPEIA